MFYLYDKIDRMFLKKEFADREDALDFLYFCRRKFEHLSILENVSKKLSHSFTVANYNSKGFYADVLELFTINNETELGEMSRYKGYSGVIRFNPKIGDTLVLYDQRKSNKVIVGFGKVETIYFNKYRGIKDINNINKLRSSFNIKVFLKDKRGNISYVSPSEIRMLEGMENVY